MPRSSQPDPPPVDSCFADPVAHEACDVDSVLRTLASPCRREILCFLDARPTWTRDELAANIGSVDVLDNQMTKPEAETLLFHQHLPRLADAGLIDATDDYRYIERGPNFDVVRDAVDAAAAVFARE